MTGLQFITNISVLKRTAPPTNPFPTGRRSGNLRFSDISHMLSNGEFGGAVLRHLSDFALAIQSTAQLPLIDSKGKLQRLFRKEIGGPRYSEHVAASGPQLPPEACKLGLESAKGASLSLEGAALCESSVILSQ